MSTLDSPIPLSDLESVLAWVDTFKLSRPTKKINRDFSDAVLLAEILSVHYPKLVEMHNYPPRNSHALKLNNWMTLNRKVLKKLKLNLCCSTMEQLANAAPGLIERVLIMVRDKIRRDEELNKSVKDGEQNISSGGSYYEACGDEEHVLVVPVKTRVNGVLETVQQKVVSYESFQGIKEELKDAKDTSELLKQKVEHLDNLLKLKDERIDELQKQLERKQTRRKEVEAYQNSLAVPFETVQSPAVADILPVSRKSSLKAIESVTKIAKPEESKIPVPIVEAAVTKTISKPSITEVSCSDLNNNQLNNVERIKSEVFNQSHVERIKSDVFHQNNVDRIRSDVFKEVEIVDLVDNRVIGHVSQTKTKDSQKIDADSLDGNEESDEPVKKVLDGSQDGEDFKDSEQDGIMTIEGTIQKEMNEIINPKTINSDLNYIM